MARIRLRGSRDQEGIPEPEPVTIPTKKKKTKKPDGTIGESVFDAYWPEDAGETGTFVNYTVMYRRDMTPPPYVGVCDIFINWLRKLKVERRIKRDLKRAQKVRFVQEERGGEVYWIDRRASPFIELRSSSDAQQHRVLLHQI